MMDTNGQPGDLAFPLRFVVAAFRDRATAEGALQTLIQHEVAADDVFVFHFGAPHTSADLSARRLGSARVYPLLPADQVANGAGGHGDGPLRLWCSLVLVYVPTPADQERAAALLQAAHGELLDAEIDLTGADDD